MTIQDIGLFQAIGAKMSYLNQRQGIIAQNIANSDTPNYRPKDLAPVDFSTMLKSLSGTKNVSIAVSDDQHMPNAQNIINPKSIKQKHTYEVAPAGNSVIIEEQLMMSGENSMDYNLMINLYQKQVGMMRTAIGR